MIDVNPNHLKTVTRILAEHVPECEVRAFGSRVTWTAKDYSDLDLAVVGKRALDADAFRRLKEAFQESDLQLITGNDQWQWRNEDLQLNYLHLRADANHAYDHRDFMVLFSIINRAVAVFDAVRNAASDGLAANVLGMDVAVDSDLTLSMELSPTFGDSRFAVAEGRVAQVVVAVTAVAPALPTQVLSAWCSAAEVRRCNAVHGDNPDLSMHYPTGRR